MLFQFMLYMLYLEILKTIWQVLQHVLIKFCFKFISKFNICYKKYGVIIYDSSWKIWAPLLKMSYQILFYSLTGINVNPLEKENLNRPSPLSPHLYPITTLGCFSFFSISFTKKKQTMRNCVLVKLKLYIVIILRTDRK